MTEEIMNGTELPEEEVQVFTLTDENGVETDFELLMSMDIDGTTYVALVPVDDNEAEEFTILKFAVEDGEDILVTIDDDDEFDRIANIFEKELFSEIDYDQE